MRNGLKWLLLTIFAVALVINPRIQPVYSQEPQPDRPYAPLIDKAQEEGKVRVIVGLDAPFVPEGELAPGAAQSQRQTTATRQEQIIAELGSSDYELIAKFKYIPYIALEVDAKALDTLIASSIVTNIEEDVPVPPTLESSTPVIGAPYAWANGFTGEGQAVAILDTGVETSHDFFTTGGARVVSEACYSTTSTTNNSYSACPGGVSESTTTGSGVDCVAAAGSYTDAQADCEHGTHVAGIAAGYDGGDDTGVANGADIIAIQVFSIFTSTTHCGTGSDGCALTYSSDQVKALERIHDLHIAGTYDIAAVNMSLGGGEYTSPCDGDSRKTIIDTLISDGIATIISSGNDSYRNATGAPGCISTAVTVGATDDDDNIASFSNIASFVDLLAPGVGINSAIPGNAMGSKSGTSMSAPMVAGAWTVVKAITPTASVNDILSIFQNTATLVDDNRTLPSGVETDMPRINLDRAINSIRPGLTIEKTASADSVLAGRRLTYTLSVSNTTDINATNVLITDTLPGDVTVDMDTLSADATHASGVITWTTGTSLASGQGLTRTFAVTVSESLKNGGTLTNTAYVSATTMADSREFSVATTVLQIGNCDFSEGFESGTLSDYWGTHFTNDGRVRVTGTITDFASTVFPPHSGSYHLILDDSIGGGDSSEAGTILTLNLEGQTAATLEFWWLENQDEPDTQDGVFISDDYGATWYQVYSFNGGSSSYTPASIDIAAQASSYGLTLNDHFQVKFQFYDNFAFEGYDGYAIDDIAFHCSDRVYNQDTTIWYSTIQGAVDTAAAGEVLSATTATYYEDVTVTDGITVVVPSGLTLNGTLANEGTLQQVQSVDTSGASFLDVQNGSGDAVFRGVEITPTASLDTVTVTVRARGDGQYCTTTGAASLAYVKRCYAITPETDGAATVKFWALSSEQNGIAESDLQIYRFNGGGWQALSNTSNGNDGGDYVYAAGDTTGFSHLLVGQSGNTPTAIFVQGLTALATPVWGSLGLTIIGTGLFIWLKKRRDQ